jgi:hypothetical protein
MRGTITAARAVVNVTNPATARTKVRSSTATVWFALPGANAEQNKEKKNQQKRESGTYFGLAWLAVWDLQFQYISLFIHQRFLVAACVQS